MPLPLHGKRWAKARTNIERLIERLQAISYEFEDPRVVFIPPQPDVHEQIASLESKAGVLPLSLRAWYEVWEQFL
jgi:hypothetical protein